MEERYEIYKIREFGPERFKDMHGMHGFGDASRGQHSWTVDEEHTREIIKRGLELGINFFDTAIGYQNGTSEQYLGRALSDFAERDEVVVATKFLPRTNEEIEKGITGQQHISRMLDKSLENLGMDYVDLYIYIICGTTGHRYTISWKV